MKIIIRKYRIVRDSFCGYEAQQWRLWLPFWCQIGFTNTFSSLDKAKEFIKTRGVVCYVDA